MRMGTIIGRVTLSVRSKRYVGERLLLTLPWKTGTFGGAISGEVGLFLTLMWGFGAKKSRNNSGWIECIATLLNIQNRIVLP